MTETQNATQPADAELQARLKDLEEENELLLLQLHQVQEELESYFLKCQELEKGGVSSCSGATSVGAWVDDEMPSLQAEVARLTALVETQSRLHEIESKNALNARLGDILIQSVSPSGSIVGLPGKLLGIWRASKAEQPSAALGGKNFDKVIEAFQKGGLESVNQLLATEPAPEMRAKAYTVLARHQMKNGLFAEAALSARRAYEEEPRPYRLKWLAFRLHDAGEIAEADACISLLPQDTPFSDSEVRQRDQVRYEAKSSRMREAKQKTDFESRQQAMESQMQALRQDCEKHTRQSIEQQEEIRSLRQNLSQLEQKTLTLSKKLEESAKLLAARETELGSLQQSKSQLEQKMSVLTENQEETAKLLAARETELGSLQQSKSQLEQKMSVLTENQEETAKLLAARETELGSLQQSKSQLEQKMSVLTENQEETAKLLVARETELGSLQQSKSQLEQKMSVLTENQEETAKLLAARETELGSLQQSKSQLEQKMSVLTENQEETAKLLAARETELGSLQQSKSQLEQKMSVLTEKLEESAKLLAANLAELDSLKQFKIQSEQNTSSLKKNLEDVTRVRDEQTGLAQERFKQIDELKLLLEERKAAEIEVEARQHLVREEMAKAEAQLDLMKDILLREPGL